MKKRKKKKKSRIKYPVVFWGTIEFIAIFGGATIMLHLDRAYNFHDAINIAVGILLCIIAIISLYKMLSGFKKQIQQQKKNSLKKLERCIKSSKPFTLIKKRRLFANFVACLGTLLSFVMWAIIIPIKIDNHHYLIIAIAITVCTILGYIFSFCFPTNLLVYKNGKFHVDQKNFVSSFYPNELLSCSKTYTTKPPKLTHQPKFDIANSLRYLSIYDTALNLTNDRTIILNKSESITGIKTVIDKIKNLGKDIPKQIDYGE